jgi:hypothetical protein
MRHHGFSCSSLYTVTPEQAQGNLLIENALAIVRGIKAAIEVEVGASQVQPDLLGHLLQGVQALGKEHHIRFIDGSHGDRS